MAKTHRQIEFRIALVEELTKLGATVTHEFRVPGTRFIIDLYIAFSVRAFIEIKSVPSSSIQLRNWLAQMRNIR
jgi:hypothetical protein